MEAAAAVAEEAPGEDPAAVGEGVDVVGARREGDNGLELRRRPRRARCCNQNQQDSSSAAAATRTKNRHQEQQKQR